MTSVLDVNARRAALLDAWLQHSSERPGLPPMFAERTATLRAQTAARDHADVQRSFPLVARGPYGAWFEGLPLPLAPRLPHARPSEELSRLVKHLALEWAGTDVSEGAVFSALMAPEAFERASEDDRRHCLWLAFLLTTLDERPWKRDPLYHPPLCIHPDPAVRALLVAIAYIDLPWVPAEQLIYRATHDTDEVVFLPAFRICGRRHDERAMDHLLTIVTHPSAVLAALSRDQMQYPVGHAACSICPGQFAILGTDDPELARARELELRKRIRQPLAVPVEHARERLYASIDAFVPPEPPREPPPDLANMVQIPGGPFRMGLDPSEIPSRRFDWSTCVPARMVDVPDFYIDRHPVTNAEYDTFVEAIMELPPPRRREFEHPGQPFAKPHQRSTRGDPRFGPDHPVVGIDWFDAWAYARWRGKELPTETQWEKAARGTTGWIYPWGNQFNPSAVRSAAETYGQEPSNLVEWVIALSRGTHEFPASTTAPVTAHPDGASPYGVQDMCGNAWEFTRTCFYTRQDVRPAFREFTPIEIMGSREGQVVIRGGAWSSPEALIGAAYRGYDLLTDRHTEIGFRCVWEPKPNKGA